jgi:hypothetical protein
MATFEQSPLSLFQHNEHRVYCKPVRSVYLCLLPLLDYMVGDKGQMDSLRYRSSTGLIKTNIQSSFSQDLQLVDWTLPLTFLNASEGKLLNACSRCAANN